MRARSYRRWAPSLLVVFYPLLVFWGLRRFAPRTIAVLGALVMILFWLREEEHRPGAGQMSGRLRWAAGLTLCGVAALLNHALALLFMPVLISSGLLALFGWTLLRPPSMVERLAVRMAGPLPEAERRYCRSVTRVWVLFFFLNMSLALYTALGPSRELWVWYNGLASYVLIGLIFVIEMIYRHWRFRRYVGLPTDFIFKKLFPPRPNLNDGHGPT